MIDSTSRWLFAQIAGATTENAVCFSDENVLPYLQAVARSNDKLELISNRWDVAQQARKLGFNAVFSDFDCSPIKDSSHDSVYYRISKEKHVVHYLINETFRILKPGGELIICGQKNEGIKTFINKAGALFDCKQSATKDGTNYHARLRKNNKYDRSLLLDDNNYNQVRVVAELNEPRKLTVYSKPGLFGWDKIDQGSALLATSLRKVLPSLTRVPQRMLDLGCGYGYLSLMTADLPLAQRVLTDNNAAALIAAERNCTINLVAAEVVATDAGSGLQSGFDLILCNPPFHQGFNVDGDLTDKFLAAAKHLLAKDGTALFVVNQFIPLERKAHGLFKKISVVTQQLGFKIVSLQL